MHPQALTTCLPSEILISLCHGIKVFEGSKGRFVSMPSTGYTDKNGEKKYNDTFPVLLKKHWEAREQLYTAVLKEYESQLTQSQTPVVQNPFTGEACDIGDISEFEEFP